ncbi:TonB family protein [Marinoscillum furvescens]|uniref:TonB family protein n=1 Tax=Marinoscillum furvescens DSM 4134 TaxID=1122208 RepID=A0A3D9KW49_MARFU|nr:TonB family protein [Marinoscillum furvescens]RED92196.1 TonB family protein [Marinoscillum furvescens DSM 4134]
MRHFHPLFLVLLIFTLCTGVVHGQAKKVGRIIDQKSKKPIPNAIVTYSGNPEGSLSNSFGYFEYPEDVTELVVSHISYATIQIPVDSYTPAILIPLKRENFTLPALTLQKYQELPVFTYQDSLRELMLQQRQQQSSELMMGPDFPGGIQSFHHYLLEEFQKSDTFPTDELSFNLLLEVDQEGAVKVQQEPQNPIALQVVGLVNNSPKWIPAFQNHEPCTSYLSQEIKITGKQLIIITEKQPQFPGGMEAFYKFVREEMNYPKKALKHAKKGRVYVRFVVEENGEISYAAPINRVGYGLDKEAVRIVRQTSGMWIPGTRNGKPTNVRMELPIIFRTN